MQLLRLLSRFAVSVQSLPKLDTRGTGGTSVQRPMSFNGSGLKAQSSFRWESLGVDDCISGPAMINGSTLSCPVPPGWSLTVDGYGNARLQRAHK